MALSFPTNPTVGQKYVAPNNVVYTWDGTKWIGYGNPSVTTVAPVGTAGTVTTAAQPNITSTGTLTSLNVTGNVAAGNLVTAGVLSVTGTGVSSIGGSLDMTGNNIINLATPINFTDAATKQYVDDVAQGLNIHDSCNVATTGTLATLSSGTVTYDNGTSGVGATLTTTGSFTTIDGVTLTNDMRILVKNEVTAANNGIYVRTSSTVLTRAADFNSVPEIEAGDFTFVSAGTVYDNTGWVQTSTVVTVGTDSIDWAQFSGAGTYSAGTGLTLTGSVFSINVAQPTITSVGTLTSLGVSGNGSFGNVSSTGTITAGNLSVTGTNNILPTGMIVMWYGSIASIPTGWYLCNGQVANGTQTPDLRNSFIVGAGSTYAVAATGGSANATLVSHTHTFTGDALAPHSHNITLRDGPGGNPQNPGHADGVVWAGYTTDSASGGTPSGTNSTEGSSGTNANLPPYYALAYIMKA